MCSTCIPAVFAEGSSSSPPRPSRSATSRSRFLASAPTSRGYPGTRPSGGRLGDRRDDYSHHPLRSAPVPSDGGLGRQVPLRADGVSNGAEKRGARSVSPVAATEAPRRADRNRTAEGGSCPDRIATAAFIRQAASCRSGSSMSSGTAFSSPASHLFYGSSSNLFDPRSRGMISRPPPAMARSRSCALPFSLGLPRRYGFRSVSVSGCART